VFFTEAFTYVLRCMQMHAMIMVDRPCIRQMAYMLLFTTQHNFYCAVTIEQNSITTSRSKLVGVVGVVNVMYKVCIVHTLCKSMTHPKL